MSVTETRLELSPAVRKFILHWGEMGTRWGVNRTVAQIHALLYIWPEPLNAEQIASTLSVARSNVSTSLRELQGWGIIRVVHVMGDRRDYFESLHDVWEMFQIILAERKRREVDPTLEMLREAIDEARRSTPEDHHTQARLKELLGFFESITRWYDQVSDLPIPMLKQFLGLGSRIRKALGLAR